MFQVDRLRRRADMGGRVAVQGHQGSALLGGGRTHVRKVRAQGTSERVLLQQESRGRAGTWLELVGGIHTNRNICRIQSGVTVESLFENRFRAPPVTSQITVIEIEIKKFEPDAKDASVFYFQNFRDRCAPTFHPDIFHALKLDGAPQSCVSFCGRCLWPN